MTYQYGHSAKEDLAMSIEIKHRFLRISDVKSTTGLSRSHIYLLISKSEFPRQYKLGERAAGWLESEVLAWMQSKITPTGSDHRSDAS